MTMPIFYKAVAPQLRENAWPTISLHPATKTPAIKWSGRNTALPTPARIAWECRVFGEFSCGIAIPPNVLAIDSDITDWPLQREILAQAKIFLGKPAMIRVGNPPKLMLFYGAARGVRSAKIHPIELFCGTGQVAAFGIHPKTGTAYEWRGGSPLQLKPSELQPIVTMAALENFLRAAAPLLRPMREARELATSGKITPILRGAQPTNPSTARLRELVTAHNGLILPGVMAWIAEVGARGTDRHNTVVALCGYLVHHGWSCEDVFRLVPCINHAFGDGCWRDEVARAVVHAQSRKWQALKSQPHIFGGS